MFFFHCFYFYCCIFSHVLHFSFVYVLFIFYFILNCFNYLIIIYISLFIVIIVLMVIVWIIIKMVQLTSLYLVCISRHWGAVTGMSLYLVLGWASIWFALCCGVGLFWEMPALCWGPRSVRSTTPPHISLSCGPSVWPKSVGEWGVPGFRSSSQVNAVKSYKQNNPQYHAPPFVFPGWSHMGRWSSMV